MKKKLLLLALQCMTMSGFAQMNEDLTPSAYKYSNLPTGKIEVQRFFQGANVPVPCNALIDELYDNGLFVVHGGQFANPDQPYAKDLQAGLSVVDLGGEVGKVFCLNGHNSVFGQDKALGYPQCTGTLNWFGFNWFMDPQNSPMGGTDEKPNIRVRVVMNIFANNLDESASIINSAYMVTNQGNVMPNGSNKDEGVNVTSGEFAETYEDGEPVADEDGNYIHDATKWMVYEWDTYCPTTKDEGPESSSTPMRLKMEMVQGNVANATMFIKEVSFTKLDNNTAPILGMRKKTFETYSVDPKSYVTAINNVTTDTSAWENAAIYDLSGIRMPNKKNLPAGTYIMKKDNKSIKFIVR